MLQPVLHRSADVTRRLRTEIDYKKGDKSVFIRVARLYWTLKDIDMVPEAGLEPARYF